MNVRNFFAATSRQALRMVKESMGPDALILSNRPVEGGVEIVAMSKDEIPSGLGAASRLASSSPKPERGTKSTAAAKPATAAKTVPGAKCAAPGPKSSPPAPEAAASSVAPEALAQKVMGELKAMRSMFEEQFSRYAWDALERHDPARAKASCTLLAAGFSPALAREFMEKLPPRLSDEQATRWIETALERNVRAVLPEEELVERGGVYALVGPTGVGKTTTAAKIAARCVVRHGAETLALLTTDGYRIGAHEQLRIYGRLLGVKVHAVKDAADLQFVLAELRGKRLVLIDTVGMSQRDRMVVEQIEMFASCDTPVQQLLLLNATSNLGTLHDVVRSYRFGPGGGCIITKIDEAMGAAAALDVVVRHRLNLHYVANGQRVPEDLHLPNRRYLVHRALSALGEAPEPAAAGGAATEALAMSLLSGAGACLA